MWEYDFHNTFDELYHYGVQGMKWGIRKERNLRESEAKLRYDPIKWEKLYLDVISEIAKTNVLLSDARNRLRELGVY